MELDLSFTADGVPVLMHDETVDRTTNGSGPVSKLHFVQLRKLDAAARHRLKYVCVYKIRCTWWKVYLTFTSQTFLWLWLIVWRDKFIGEKVPALQEAVEECIRHQLTIFFDVKGQPDKVLNMFIRHINIYVSGTVAHSGSDWSLFLLFCLIEMFSSFSDCISASCDV